ncbi:antitoxin VapB family protein [Halosimplex marinum]|uniref:antitoxin VapB family protein n=1 Tax=Halosimplex marinum TaxID=3396620 RepID=UPI003F555DFA
MGPKTVELDGVAYERLRAEKREGEGFSDLVKRVTEAVRTDWRRGFGKYGGADGERLERAARQSREHRGGTRGQAVRRVRRAGR